MPNLTIKWFCCRRGWSMLYVYETMVAAQLMGTEVWPQCSAPMVWPSPSAPAAWAAMGQTRQEGRFHKFSTTGTQKASILKFCSTSVIFLFFLHKLDSFFCYEGVSMMGISSLSCWAKPMKKTRTAAELCLWSVPWSELQRTCFTELLLSMVTTA